MKELQFSRKSSRKCHQPGILSVSHCSTGPSLSASTSLPCDLTPGSRTITAPACQRRRCGSIVAMRIVWIVAGCKHHCQWSTDPNDHWPYWFMGSKWSPIIQQLNIKQNCTYHWLQKMPAAKLHMCQSCSKASVELDCIGCHRSRSSHSSHSVAARASAPWDVEVSRRIGGILECTCPHQSHGWSKKW